MRVMPFNSINYNQQKKPNFGMFKVDITANNLWTYLPEAEKFIALIKSKIPVAIEVGLDKSTDRLVGIIQARPKIPEAIRTKEDILEFNTRAEGLINKLFFKNKGITISQEEAEELIKTRKKTCFFTLG